MDALPLIIWPQAINGLLTLDSATAAINPSNALATYYARSLGFAQITLGLVTVVLTGSLPLTSLVETPGDQPSPFASAVLLITTLYHGSTAFYCWAQYNVAGQTGFMLGFIGNVVLASSGLWCLMFGGERPRISKRTGADKRTSGFPFSNAEAAKRHAGKKGL
ncbi:hypothetical protein DL771_005560 [Monosporascus sp. 5C6A]|nr:hypothetical protein DL771_005560 [Monosporascus sp. 5C6A]